MNIKNRIEKYLPKNTLSLLMRIGRLADESGYNSYIVGGTVRDIITGAGGDDIDIAIEGDAIRIAEALNRDIGGVIVTYRSFGTSSIKVKKGLKLDMAMTRREVYKRPGAMPQVKMGSLEDDLKRRDFTINAMAVSISHKDFGKLFDPFNGRRDLKDGLIRVMHDGSFRDDPTRILRALRFASRFGFRIESRTKRLMESALESGAIDTVSSGRIEKEIKIMRK